MCVPPDRNVASHTSLHPRWVLNGIRSEDFHQVSQTNW
jgi:hypothetical protein